MKKGFSFYFALSAVAFAAPVDNAALAEVYIVRSAGGVVTFTSRKPAAGQFETLKSKRPTYSYFVRRGGGVWRARVVKSQYDELIKRTATVHRLDPHLVKAVVQVESNFNCKAKSNKGAMGLMQLMPGTAKRYGVGNAFHPEANMKGGSQYLKWLLDRYSGNVTLAVAAYNAGEGAVDNYRNIPPYAETQTYVKRVLSVETFTVA